MKAPPRISKHVCSQKENCLQGLEELHIGARWWFITGRIQLWRRFYNHDAVLTGSGAQNDDAVPLLFLVNISSRIWTS